MPDERSDTDRPIHRYDGNWDLNATPTSLTCFYPRLSREIAFPVLRYSVHRLWRNPWTLPGSVHRHLRARMNASINQSTVRKYVATVFVRSAEDLEVKAFSKYGTITSFVSLTSWKTDNPLRSPSAMLISTRIWWLVGTHGASGLALRRQITACSIEVYQ